MWLYIHIIHFIGYQVRYMTQYTLTEEQKRELKEKLGSFEWRIWSGKLYKVKNKQKKTVPFIPNIAQKELLDSYHTRNIIPKARQKWFSTLIDIWALDFALFNKNADVLIIAHDRESMLKIFKNKVKFTWDHLPERLKAQYEVKADKANELSFSRDGKSWSTISVALSGRSGTYQFLHVSEFWKICAKFPQKAEEVVTGAIEAVPKDGLIFIESTAEGDEWYFYDRSVEAYDNQERWYEPSNLEFKLHFSPRWTEPEYTIKEKVDIVFTAEHKRYFNTLEQEHWIYLTEWQKIWYVLKLKTQKDKMKREYPSVFHECFESSIEGSYYSLYLLEAWEQQRIGKVPYDSALPVYVWFDLWGAEWSDLFSLWWFQIYGREARMINYWQGNEDLKYIANKLLPSLNYDYKILILPWDWQIKMMWDHRKSRAYELQKAWYNVHFLPQSWISRGIDTAKKVLPLARFDQEKCAEWLKALRNYKKKRNTSLWKFEEKPKHDKRSHWADAFRYSSIYIWQYLEQLGMTKDVTQQRWRVSLVTREVKHSQWSHNRFTSANHRP